MTGEELYMLYVEAHADEGIGVDEWDDLDARDHAIWDTIAAQITLKPLGE